MWSRAETVLIDFVEQGKVHGLELYYSTQTPEVVKTLKSFLRHVKRIYGFNLLTTLGTDFGHISKNVEIKIGRGINNSVLPYNNYEDCEKFKRRL